MKRFFRLALSGLAMLAVALASALLAMRFAIHGSEVEVPNLTNLTIPEASELTLPKGLQLTLENRYYSLDTPAGRILSQSPAPGTHVRRGWQLRITESLGAQKVEIPNVIGQDERGATVNIRRLSLDLGTVAHLAVPGDPDIVLAQTPPPNAEGVDRPRVSLLLSEAPDAAAGDAVVTPILTGLTLGAAGARANASGLRLSYGTAAPASVASVSQANAPSVSQANAPAASHANSPSASPAGAPPAPAASANVAPGAMAPDATPAPVSSGGVVIGQSPAAGHRILRGEAVHITLGSGAAPATP